MSLSSAITVYGIQIKSRKDAPFQVPEVQNFLNYVEGKSAKLKGGKKTRSVIVLEQPRHSQIAFFAVEHSGCDCR